MASASMMSRTAAPAASPRCGERRVAPVRLQSMGSAAAPRSASLSSRSAAAGVRLAAPAVRSAPRWAAPRGARVGGSPVSFLGFLRLTPRPQRAALKVARDCRVVAGAMEAGCGVLANKAGMTSFFTPEGLQVPVTVIALLPGNIVTQARAAASCRAASCRVSPSPRVSLRPRLARPARSPASPKARPR
jgi:hypothetical protein